MSFAYALGVMGTQTPACGALCMMILCVHDTAVMELMALTAVFLGYAILTWIEQEDIHIGTCSIA